jgi:hypothetical protein
MLANVGSADQWRTIPCAGIVCYHRVEEVFSYYVTIEMLLHRRFVEIHLPASSAL